MSNTQQAQPQGPAPPQDPNTSSHMMKTTKRGRPYLKDTLDLFATLIVSLDLGPHKQFFRTFPNSFTTDEAAANLAQLKFSQSNRGPDPRDTSRVVTTTTTTTFSMTREMAKSMCQHFMDARLIENATDPSSNLFKDRAVYVLTPKGLHVLERFISKNGMMADKLQPVFSTQPICIKLLHLERRSIDDEIIVSQSVITTLFRRFAGKVPNYPQVNPNMDVFQKYSERSRGVPLMEVTERQSTKGQVSHKHCFAAVTALEWLCDFTSVVGREEAAEMAAQFVRFGLISLVHDKRKNNDSAIIFTVRGSAPGGNSVVSQQGEFRCTAKAIYKITEEGRRLVHWENRPFGLHMDSPNASSTNLADRSSMDDMTVDDKKGPEGGAKIHRRISMVDKMNSAYEAHERKVKESNTDRLKYILEDPSLRSLFREFLRGNFCEENLSFWLDVQDFKRRFVTTSSAASGSHRAAIRNTPGHQAMEQHHEALINTAFAIHNKYLAPASQCELNIDHGLRNELTKYLEEIVLQATGKAFQGRIEPEHAATFTATQLQKMIGLYERIQTHVFRLMATDSVPKFIKTPKFLAMRNWDEDFEPPSKDSYPAAPPGLTEEVGGAYVTVSQQASERESRENGDSRQGGSAPGSP